MLIVNDNVQEADCGLLSGLDGGNNSQNGKPVETVDGANAPDLTETVKKHVQSSAVTTAKATAASTTHKEDINVRLKTLTNSAPVMVFIKGTPSQPRCGYSRKLVEILGEHNVKYSSFNILADEDVRQGANTENATWP